MLSVADRKNSPVTQEKITFAFVTQEPSGVCSEPKAREIAITHQVDVNGHAGSGPSILWLAMDWVAAYNSQSLAIRLLRTRM